MTAAEQLEELGVDVEIVDVQSLPPFDVDHHIVESLKKTNRLLVLDEDVPGGASAYIMQQVRRCRRLLPARQSARHADLAAAPPGPTAQMVTIFQAAGRAYCEGSLWTDARCRSDQLSDILRRFTTLHLRAW
ncbi:MAG: transketolase C-terminal domain-containing protein [Bacteroidia bacterium]